MVRIYESLIDLEIVVSIGPGLLIDVPRGTNITGMFSTLLSVHIL
jgi:hypothetical protein